MDDSIHRNGRQPRRILITGGAGFIGSHLGDRLAALGCQVIAFDNESTGCRGNVHSSVCFVHGDILDRMTLEVVFREGIDVVLHLAAQVSNIQSFQNPRHYLAVNVQGTLNVLEKCIEHRVPRLIYASTMHVYGQPEGLPINERTACDPLSFYGITKYAAERFVHRMAARSDLDGPIHVTSFRMFNVYGPRQSLDNPYQGVVSVFISNLLRQEPLVLYGSGHQTRDFVYIDDIISAWITAIDAPETYGELINLGTGRETSIIELTRALLEISGQGPDYPILQKPPLEGDQLYSYADIQKARQLLGWQPWIEFPEGLRRTVTWAKSVQVL